MSSARATSVHHARPCCETVLLTGGAIALGSWLAPERPFLLGVGFPWLPMAPLLSGLRFGTVYGLASAAVIVAEVALGWRLGLFVDGFPSGLCLGVVVTGIVAGEFRDWWHRRIRRFAAASQGSRRRLDEFTRAYHLLKVSHDRLENRLIGRARSLRGALLGMRKRLVRHDAAARPLAEIADDVLAVFAAYGSVDLASLFIVDEEGRIAFPAAARLGSAREVAADDPLVAEALRSRTVVAVRQESAAQHRGTDLLAAVPLTDVTGKTWGIVAVEEMPFLSFHQESLELLAVLGGHIGDVLMGRAECHGADGVEEAEFTGELRRCLVDLREHRLPAATVGMAFHDESFAGALTDLVLEERRGLDRILAITAPGGPRTLLVLLPQTDGEGLRGYLARMEVEVEERLGRSSGEAGLIAVPRLLRPEDTVEGVLAYLREVCQVGEADAVRDRGAHR